jgi:hypothetical protein
VSPAARSRRVNVMFFMSLRIHTGLYEFTYAIARPSVPF